MILLADLEASHVQQVGALRLVITESGGDATRPKRDGASVRRMRPLHPLMSRLTALHASLIDVRDGEVATYIPALAHADPDTFALCLATSEGRRYSVGSSTAPFSIQSVSKPFVYALALADSGVDHVLARVGTEPTGDAFNAVTLETGTGRPLNPMVNAGAIETACLVAGVSAAEKTERIRAGLSAFAGRDLTIDRAVQESEADTGDRNRALAYLMHGAGSLSSSVDDALEVYFAQCAVLVTVDDLALMAATLANGGVNPETGRQVVPGEVVGPVLSVMAMCGMYDAAGTWLVNVGLPAKSGVSGAILAVLPGQFGLGVYSPPLDPQGNSVRGMRACEALSADLGLHLFAPTGVAASPIRRWTTGAMQRSVASRTPDERALLDEAAHRIQIVELQGPLNDLAVEMVVHRLLDGLSDGGPWLVVIDTTHVATVHAPAAAVLEDALQALQKDGSRIAVVDPRVGSRLAVPVAVDLADVLRVPDRDRALAAFENEVLGHHARAEVPDSAVPLAEHEVLRDLAVEHRAAVDDLLATQVLPAGSIVLEAGSPADGLVWVSAGEVSVLVRGSGGRWRRVSGIAAGGVLGEVSMIDGMPRSARVVSDTPVLLHHLDGDAVATLQEARPDAYAGLVLALARLLSSRLRRANTVIQALQD